MPFSVKHTLTFFKNPKMKNSANTTYPLRSILIPFVLLVYLAVMVVLGWPSYECGATSGLLYFGGTAVTLTCIVALHFHLRRRIGRRHT